MKTKDKKGTKGQKKVQQEPINQKLEEEASIEEIDQNEEDFDNDEDEIVFQKLSLLFIKLEGKGLPVKNAKYGKERTDYVRGDDLLKCFKDNIEMICKEIDSIRGKKIDPTSDNAIQEIYYEFNSLGMLMKALKYKDDSKIKYPKRLLIFEDEEDDCCKGSETNHHGVSVDEMRRYDEKMFYAIHINRDKKSTYMWLFIIIGAVLLYCLFPVWPYELKVGIWWVCYILVNFMIGLLVIRLILHGLFYIFGADFWLYPNLLDEKLGVIDSFKPFASIQKRTETTLTIIIRLAITIFIGYLAFIVYENPQTVNDFGQHVFDVYVDVFDWGKEKIVNYGVNFYFIFRIQLQ